MANRNKYFGNIADPNILGDSAVKDVLKSDFGQITPEYSMKWAATEPNRDVFTFGEANQTAKFALETGKILRCHTLLWHRDLPEWVYKITSASELTRVIENHISIVVRHFVEAADEQQTCYAWDVVNEIFNDDGSFRSGPFFDILGETFVSIAFHAARKADQNAKLYINDYGLDDIHAPKTVAMVAKVEKWLAAGVPIDGIGSQSHLYAGVSGTEDALNSLLSSGVKEVAITELDIAGAAAQDYVEVVQACLNIKECAGITLWGVNDARSWRSGEAATLFQSDGRPKEADHALIKLLDGRDV